MLSLFALVTALAVSAHPVLDRRQEDVIGTAVVTQTLCLSGSRTQGFCDITTVGIGGKTASARSDLVVVTSLSAGSGQQFNAASFDGVVCSFNQQAKTMSATAFGKSDVMSFDKDLLRAVNGQEAFDKCKAHGFGDAKEGSFFAEFSSSKITSS
ncbi:hypothetical protein DL96DRAFT_1684136 [Flagelloscypha sp. PMI_526]|nr:hypothetical protein DL96DRAFT_1684136 [Flagelloscypha sp. PMI_526]